jgi:hypothetical protein
MRCYFLVWYPAAVLFEKELQRTCLIEDFQKVIIKFHSVELTVENAASQSLYWIFDVRIEFHIEISKNGTTACLGKIHERYLVILSFFLLI